MTYLYINTLMLRPIFQDGKVQMILHHQHLQRCIAARKWESIGETKRNHIWQDSNIPFGFWKIDYTGSFSTQIRFQT